jgi:hypothetical protein
VTYPVHMLFSATQINSGSPRSTQIIIDQDLQSRPDDAVVTYQLRCEDPLVDILLNATNRQVHIVDVDYPGDYLITQTIHSPSVKTVQRLRCQEIDELLTENERDAALTPKKTKKPRKTKKQQPDAKTTPTPESDTQ